VIAITCDCYYVWYYVCFKLCVWLCVILIMCYFDSVLDYMRLHLCLISIMRELY